MRERGAVIHQAPPLWRCPKCGAELVVRNMSHSCGRYSLKALFARSEPWVFRLFRKFERMVRACGPVKMIPQKTRAVFLTRVRFAAVYPRKSGLLCSIALPRVHRDPRFREITRYAKHFVTHIMLVERENQLDRQVQSWLKESYAVGEQRQVLQSRWASKHHT